MAELVEARNSLTAGRFLGAMEEQEAPPAIVPDECAGQAVRDYAPLCARDIDELIADGDERETPDARQRRHWAHTAVHAP